jgi:trimeric autotransporter adhesin
LWSSDATADGTAMVADINGTSTADVTNLINMNGVLYFSAYTTTYGFQVWQSDETASGTVMDTNLDTGTLNIPTNFVVMGTARYFTAPGPRCGHGHERESASAAGPGRKSWRRPPMKSLANQLPNGHAARLGGMPP